LEKSFELRVFKHSTYIAGSMTLAPSTDHAVRHIFGEDIFALLARVLRKLGPLKSIGKEDIISRGKSPSSAVADCLRGDFCVRALEHFNWLDIWVSEVEWLRDSNKSNIIIECRVIPICIEFHGCNISLLMASL
jgi:hypothetical protein